MKNNFARCLALGTVLLAGLCLGCSAAQPAGAPPPDRTPAPAGFVVPAWAEKIPSAPGEMIFGIGSAIFSTDDDRANALYTAGDRARQQIAEVVNTQLPTMIRDEKLRALVARSVLWTCVAKARIVREYSPTAPGWHGQRYVFALAVIDVMTVADTIFLAAHEYLPARVDLAQRSPSRAKITEMLGRWQKKFFGARAIPTALAGEEMPGERAVHARDESGDEVANAVKN